MHATLDDNTRVFSVVRGLWPEDTARQFVWIVVHPGLQ